jgi:23S rRNA pseudouridine1911/1915/1917 synthase
MNTYNEEEIEDTEEAAEQDLFEHHRIVCDKGQALLRIDKYLMHKMQNASRSKIQYAADTGCILVNDKAVKSSYKVKPFDVISIVLPHPPKDMDSIAPEEIPLDIIYEDDDLLIVNKPAGMVVHPGYNNVTGTLVNALAWHLRDTSFAKDGNIRPGLVHRIDKDTTGLLVVAKNELSMTHLAKQFFNHSIRRSYIALAWGDFDEDDGTVTGYIGRSSRDRRVFTMFPEEDKEQGKWSITHYKVLERLNYVTLIECKLETGRTHQIRVHMKHIGHSLFSDSTYGGDRILKGTTFTKYKQFIDNCFTIMPRQALHARSLGFVHPTTGEDMFFEIPLPADFAGVLEKWRGYNQNVISKELD